MNPRCYLCQNRNPMDCHTEIISLLYASFSDANVQYIVDCSHGMLSTVEVSWPLNLWFSMVRKIRSDNS